MAGFFHLGGEGTQSKREEQAKEAENSSLLLFRNEEIYNNKGFEIWPNSQYYYPQQTSANLYSFAVGPSRRSASTSDDNVSDDLSRRSGFTIMRSGSGLGSSTNCQDCGNQAKKDCSHLRCRTCCKSRGFQCATHVKSTWVPAAKRRERQQQLAALQQQQQRQQQEQQQLRGEPSRRHRDHQAAAASLACPSLPITTTGFELGQFPPEVNSPALFRCVKVNAMDTATDEQYAYQTAINIGGHVFKGILYDHGPEGPYATAGESSSGGGDAQLNLITTPTTTTATSNTQMLLLDPSLYSAPLNAFMAGTQFFPPPRS